LRIGRSLNVLTSSSHLPFYRKTLKTYLNTSVRLDTFASRQHLPSYPGKHHHAQSQTPSAHTYRLLVFKEHSLPTARSLPSEPCRFRVAASAAQKRDYVVRFAFRQQVFYRFVTNIISTTWTFQFRRSTALLGSPATEIEQLTPLLPASLRLIQKRRGRILVPPQMLRKGFVKRI